ncbi:hypothetical protein GUJ93_ZPchr0012g20364 [Zizania palustris]|uniref:Uncharacterized protein n=1 Tax=Zizania palustris TaxID=103762 RepID=A0A8J5WQG9_ZIZPA|nr:hypothetical protein GUJ93_ZPchr0012g20364 [Zizania palustris]
MRPASPSPGTHTSPDATSQCCSKGAGRATYGDEAEPTPSKAGAPSRGTSSYNGIATATKTASLAKAAAKKPTVPINDVLGRAMGGGRGKERNKPWKHV